MEDIVIAIDGFSGTGKSSTAKAVARRLNYRYIDSGAMYRAVTLYFLEKKVDFSKSNYLTSVLGEIDLDFSFDPTTSQSRIKLNGRDVEEEIRNIDVNQYVSSVASISLVRKKLVSQQRKIGKNKAIVMDGRDIGTVVFPEAELKIFMTASVEIRAERRYQELQSSGVRTSMDKVKFNLVERDNIDSTRQDSPLKKAKEAFEIDTTNLTFEDQVNKIVNLARDIIGEN